MRTAQILSKGPLQDVGLELIYLRIEDLARPGVLVLTAILIEAYEYLYQWVTAWTGLPSIAKWSQAVNGVQALLLLAAALMVYSRVRGYTGAGQRHHTRAFLSDVADRRGPRAPPPEVEELEREDDEEE